MDDASEMWRPVPEWEGLYQVSDRGRVRSVDRVLTRTDGQVARYRGRILRGGITKGYEQVRLCRAGQTPKRAYTHTLVAEAFHGSRPEGLEVRHLDGDPRNNTSTNLAWGTTSQNTTDRVDHGTDVNRRKARCPRRHRLVEPNLRRDGRDRGYRRCLACSKAGDAVAYAKSRGRVLDLQAESDRRYAIIMS